MLSSSGRSGMRRRFLSGIRPAFRAAPPRRDRRPPSAGPSSSAAVGLHPSHSLSPGPSRRAPRRPRGAGARRPPRRSRARATICRSWPSTIAVWHVGGRALAARVRVDLLRPHAEPHALAGAAPRGPRGRSRSGRRRRPPTSWSPSRSSVPSRWFMSPMKSATNGVAGPVVDLRGGGELVDVAGVHDGDAVGHRHRLLLVVRDHDEGDADVALDPLELDLHRLAQLEVERAERLVEQQHLRVHDERAGERDALLHAARELRRLGLLAAGEADELERLGRLAVALLLADLALLEAVGDVVEHASCAGTARTPGRRC